MVGNVVSQEAAMKIRGGLKVSGRTYPRPCSCGKSDCWIYTPDEARDRNDHQEAK